tara:strand:+ start:941 stop:2197 length:1257 start_codon:yes stop_codon:yes gene_type:complete
MATFEAQVEGLTSIDITGSTSVTQDELSQFLKDGVIDVTNRCLAVRPQDAEEFGRETSISDSQGVSVGGARIISVLREAGADGSSDGSTAWEPCRKVPLSIQSRVVDPDSLEYASAYNPVYTISGDKTINVYPVPSSNNGFKVFYVNEEPRDISGNAALIYSHSNIKYFPNDKVYLVVLYAAIKVIQATMGSKSLSTLSITAVPPDTPSSPNFSGASVSDVVTRAILASAPTFTKPTVGGTATELTSLTALDSQNTIDDFDGNAIEVDQWFATAAHLIEDEEDPELAQLQLQKISTYINAYQAEVQTQLNEFNEANIAYQQDVQEALSELQVAAAKAQKNADLAQQKEIAEYTNKLQRYQAEISGYQADVANQVQEYTASIQEATTEYQWLQSQYTLLKKDYDDAFAIMAPRQPQGAR